METQEWKAIGECMSALHTKIERILTTLAENKVNYEDQINTIENKIDNITYLMRNNIPEDILEKIIGRKQQS